jgi:hypothetical protein
LGSFSRRLILLSAASGENERSKQSSEKHLCVHMIYHPEWL